ncbi:NAD(P)-dependent oxidoreductase [Salinarimonas ramus]|uniref:3-hydroxyisobutyrate dehydrogenase n=1 Tax=Salinarimonas ramus TaxID=690164 RepID=A0A917QHB5_9HYPH|nr:NAD(P)-dependent oxidoreductase [Salinarimonas ramus]GGK49105.1 3-hydroxyisobutyrate dehydrogenase [Salinarimonas ramus]
MSETTKPTIGVLGLGIMGLAYARHLLAAGHPVLGYDVADEAKNAFVEAGGRLVEAPRDLARETRIVLVALASEKALRSALLGEDGVLAAARSDTILVEMGTFAIPLKEEIRSRVEAAGARMLDCPVSGTGAQAATRDLVVYASGDPDAIARARPALEAVARQVMEVGLFGAGMKLKIVANLLVTVHNLAAAEALHLAERSGLDLQTVFEAIRSGAGTSRMFEVRGPLMIEDRYRPATMRMATYMKDLDLILDHARDVRATTPLMAAALPWYVTALGQGRDEDDTAALYPTLRAAAGGAA